MIEILTFTVVALAVSTLLAGWTYAWLHWCFNGEVRHFLLRYVAPKSWLDDDERQSITYKDNDELNILLLDVPAFWGTLLSCPVCMTAHITLYGLLSILPLLVSSLGWSVLFAVPIIWGAASGLTLKLWLK